MNNDKQVRLIKAIEQDKPKDMHQVLDEIERDYSERERRRFVSTINSIAERVRT